MDTNAEEQERGKENIPVDESHEESHSLALCKAKDIPGDLHLSPDLLLMPTSQS